MIKAKQLVINGQLSSYTEAGEGADVLLLHGWGCNANTFKDVQTELAKQYRVVAVDFPGFGKSEEPKEAWGCTEYATWTEELIRKTNMTDPVILAHSFGGRVAMILNTKVNFKKLILTGAAGLVMDTDVERRKDNAKYGSVKSVLQKVLPKSAFEWMKDKAIQQIGSADYKNANPQMREIFKKVIAEDLKEYAAKVKVPTLLIWGENDKDTPVAMAKAFNSLIPQSTLHVLANCGHYAFIDNKNEFIRLTGQFLNNPK